MQSQTRIRILLRWMPEQTATARLVAVALGAALVGSMAMSGCSRSVEVERGAPIDVGPWTFSVESATARTESGGSGSRYRHVMITLRLHNYRERHRQNFDDLMNNCSEGPIPICNPMLWLVDGDRNRFLALLEPASGGSLRSERWKADFVLIPDSFRDFMRADSDALAAEHLNKEVVDLRAIIENPSPRRGQIRRVSVPLG